MHYLSYHQPQSQNWDMKENQSWPTKEFSEKTKKVHFQRVFAQRPNALQSAKCLVNPLIGSSPTANETDDNFCTTATQLWKKHILFREQLLLARIYFYKNTMRTKLQIT